MEQTAGFREKGTNNININLLSDHNMSALGGVKTLGHELSHYKGNSREDYADLDGGHLAGSLFGNNLSSGNVYDKNLVNAREYISGQEITPELIENSKIANAVPEGNRENKVYVAARDLAGGGALGMGTHQFSILVPDNPKDFTKDKLKEMGITEPMRDLGNGKRGWVVGAHNDDKKLIAKFNEPSDFKATQEFLNPKKYTKWYSSDFDTEAYLVKHQGLTDTQYITKILENTTGYQNNRVSIPYPTNKQTIKDNNQTINSNSWNQSILKHSGGTKVQQDFKGFDHGKQNIIPKYYFNSNNEE